MARVGKFANDLADKFPDEPALLDITRGLEGDAEITRAAWSHKPVAFHLMIIRLLKLFILEACCFFAVFADTDTKIEHFILGGDCVTEFIGKYTTNYPLLTAAGILAVIPPAIVALARKTK